MRERLTTCIDTLHPDDHPNHLVNVVSGKIAAAAVNVDTATIVGTKMMNKYESQWPSSFHKPLSKKVVTMAVSRKHIKVGQVPVYNTNLI